MYTKEIAMPEGVTIEISGTSVKISGPKGQLERDFKMIGVNIEKKEKKIILVHLSEIRLIAKSPIVISMSKIFFAHKIGKLIEMD